MSINKNEISEMMSCLKEVQELFIDNEDLVSRLDQLGSLASSISQEKNLPENLKSKLREISDLAFKLNLELI